MPDCLFCKIANKEIGNEFVLENDDVVAFNDINPKAPVHVLIIPKKHITTVNDIATEDEQLVGKLFSAAKEIAAKKGIAVRGYRLVMNCGEDGGQVVPHLHLHLLGGKKIGPKGQEF